MYCGIGSIPKGKIRGTPEFCVQSNQVRYYGLEKINKSLLKTAKGSTTNLIKEQLKLKKIETDAKILLKEVATIKIILDNDTRASQRKRAEKRMSELVKKRDTLVKRLTTQKKVVDALEQEEARIRKKESKTNKKNSSKSGSKSKSNASSSKSSKSKSSKGKSKSGKSRSKSGKSRSKSKNLRTRRRNVMY